MIPGGALMMFFVRIWILLSAGLVAGGWVLSALHQLNTWGYAVWLALLGGVIWWVSAKSMPDTGGDFGRRWRVARRRYHRWVPGLFVVFVGLSVLGGILYEPPPYDSAMYRTPRVLHWLAEGQWHWIHTYDIRMNIANCGFEWLSAPLLLFTHTDRFLVVINLLSYLMMPGLFFKFFRQVGAGGRVAWWWMWLLPGALCFAIQAGSLANDAFAAVYGVAAVVLALEGRTRGRVGDLWLSLLAVGLLTGVKQTYLPLVVLWAAAAIPAWRLLAVRPVTTFGVALLGVLVSFLPMVLLNMLHDGNWVGVPRHPGPEWKLWQGMQSSFSFWSVVGNTVSITLQTFVPPVFPLDDQWEAWIVAFQKTPFGSHFASFPNFCGLASCVNEQSAGLGPMMGGLMVFSLVWSLLTGAGKKTVLRSPGRPVWTLTVLRWVPLVLVLILMAKVRIHELVRQLCVYYPFIVGFILTRPGMENLVRRAWWRWLAGLSLGMTLMVLVVNQVRPLWPANTILSALSAQFPHSRLLKLGCSFYSVAGQNHKLRHYFDDKIPAEEKVVGYGTDERFLEGPLWVPFSRRVERLRADDSPDYLHQLNIRYLVLETDFLVAMGCTYEEFLRKFDGEEVSRLNVFNGVEQASDQIVYLVRIRGKTTEISPSPGGQSGQTPSPIH